jgi:hypothetical protein
MGRENVHPNFGLVDEQGKRIYADDEIVKALNYGCGDLRVEIGDKVISSPTGTPKVSHILYMALFDMLTIVSLTAGICMWNITGSCDYGQPSR